MCFSSVRHDHSQSYFFLPPTSKQFTAFYLALPEEPHRTCAGIHLMTIAEDLRYAGESELDGCGPASQITLDGWCFPRQSVLE